MPTFTADVNVNEWIDADVDISVEEFFEAMSPEEEKEMFELLQENGHGFSVDSRSVDAYEFQQALTKLSNAYYSLSNADIAPILQLAKRF